ncbi:MAG: GGDEF domain-containing protein [Anaerolineales bacterium]|nr:GGDEF domain-containing protein [Anaerolineales bacterium]
MSNRRHLFEQASALLDRCQSQGQPIAVLVFDIDHFKRINDTYGHGAGDSVLRAIADVCRRSVRATDLAARVGGEEFVVVMPGTPLEGALELAERLRLRVWEIEHTVAPGIVDRATISVGVAASDVAGSGLAELMHSADEALYRAKAAGRNRSVAHSPAPVTA